MKKRGRQVSRAFCIVVYIGILIAVARVILIGSVATESPTMFDIYKDMAHVFIGGLGATCLIRGKAWQWCLFWFLVSVEVTVAVVSRVMGS